jgi:large subunit ribosomal protein L1
MFKYPKKYKQALDQIKAKPFYNITEAVKLLKSTSTTKFDSTAEIHMKLFIDPVQADQTMRGTVVLPHGTGKKLKIAAIVSDDKVKAAKEAGASAAGLEELIAEFATGKVNYDIIVATPDVMKHLGKVAKVLGQKGMMPNPKSGTVSENIVKIIEELGRGRIEFRNDKESNVHSIFGKVSFKEEELENNLKTFLQAIKDAKPSGVKGALIKTITITSTMGPGIHLDVNEVMTSLSK